ncbi:ribose ABC transporter substrate-binding protein [Mycobacterium antarcticum]|uniref:substrate-binding domain-containing protein n=1 Tax=unclassified Mycolicibacterium TaxID=2636767 RepID=UPI0023974D2B|nr:MULTISPECIES: substrate-binding domain-containing protein [unclassified Mycolicibacterium]BDX31475.1 ribose ABC transporter substrate-binding protein [Mycolicibacterium sp. TUM20985]GLP74822.1 ribose ABC transporter substrate-binding protein [Mycolicibacterium sp. TUM20983]GLP80622.1 ribose ABC transporter substrate-binding protein [Mycolicibacterium sp. TUM20984]
MAAGPGVEEDDSSARRTRVPALTRAAAVLREISAAGVPLTLAEVTALTGYPKSSVMGICHALTQERLLSRGVDGTYALGSHVYELASTARAQGWPIHDIGFTYPVDESFFVAEIEALHAEADRLGARLHAHTAREDRARQSRQIIEFVCAGVDLILIEPVATEGLEDACARARAARIPVVALGSAVSGADAVVATDNTKAGFLAGSALASALGERGRIAVVGGIPITANSDRIAGFMAAIAPHPHLEVVATSHGELDAESGRRAAKEILSSNAVIDGFFAANDQIAIGISSVLRRRRRPVPIVGVDGARGAVEEIRAGGPIIATATQDPAALVRAAMDLGIALHGGARVPRSSRYLAPRLIDAHNAARYEPWG